MYIYLYRSKQEFKGSRMWQDLDEEAGILHHDSDYTCQLYNDKARIITWAHNLLSLLRNN
jgi:hypothetical protein